jgi:hypothetical protein
MRLLRLAYAAEFFLILNAVFTAWSQIGGQGHLDLMPWYWKLALAMGLSFSCVKATAAAVEREQLWNSQTLKWIALVLLMAVLCGLVTYYYHLYEPEEEESEESVTTLWDRQAPIRADVRQRAAEL